MSAMITPPSSPLRRSVRTLALGIGGVSALFWLYTFHAIAQVPVGDGSGFQWVAVMPLGMVFFALTLPALMLAWRDRLVWLAVVLALLGAVAFALLWRELLSEFYH